MLIFSAAVPAALFIFFVSTYSQIKVQKRVRCSDAREEFYSLQLNEPFFLYVFTINNLFATEKFVDV